MDKKISLEHAIKNIVRESIGGPNTDKFKGTPKPFLQPSPHIEPKVGDSHPDASSLTAKRGNAKIQQSETMKEEEKLEEASVAKTATLPQTGIDIDAITSLGKEALRQIAKSGVSRVVLANPYAAGAAAFAKAMTPSAGAGEAELAWEKMNKAKREKIGSAVSLETPAVKAARAKAVKDTAATIGALSHATNKKDNWADTYSKTPAAQTTLKNISKEKAETSSKALQYSGAGTLGLGNIAAKQKAAETSSKALQYSGAGTLGLGNINKKTTASDIPAAKAPDVPTSIPTAKAPDVPTSIPTAKAPDVSSTETEKKLAADAKTHAAAIGATTGAVSIPRPADAVVSPADRAAAAASVGAAAGAASKATSVARTAVDTLTDTTSTNKNKLKLPFKVPRISTDPVALAGAQDYVPTNKELHASKFSSVVEDADTERQSIENVARPGGKNRIGKQGQIKTKIIDEQSSKRAALIKRIKKEASPIIVNPELKNPDNGSN